MEFGGIFNTGKISNVIPALHICQLTERRVMKKTMSFPRRRESIHPILPKFYLKFELFRLIPNFDPNPIASTLYL